MAFDIGVNVIEVDGATAPSITGAAVSVAGFCVSTERGIPNQPTRVTSYTQFAERFGGCRSGSLGAYLVKGFFDNGGQTAYVNRIVDPTSDTAKLVLKSGPRANDPVMLTIEGGYRGQPDPGKWAEQLFVKLAYSASATSRLLEDKPAKIAGNTIAEPVNMSTLPPLQLEVDGAPLQVTFQITDFNDSAKATRQEIKNAVNAFTNLVKADIDTDKLTLTSTGEQASQTTGFTSLKVSAANDTLGLAATGANPVVGTVKAFNKGGTTLASAAKFAVGDLIEITDGTNSAEAKIAAVDPVRGSVSWTPDLANAAQFTDPRKVTVATTEFDLTIAKGKGDGDHVVETFPGLSMHQALGNFAERVIDDPLNGSRYVKATVPQGQTARPAETDWTALQSGVEGVATATEFIGDEAARTGLFAFDPFDIQLLCCEPTDVSVAKAALGYCEKRGDAMFVGAVPKGWVAAGQAVGYGQQLQTAKAYGAVYGPWIVVPDPIGVGDNPMLTIPPTGHVMGVYARIETTRGIWKAPAGDEANLRGALDVETRLSAADHTDLVVNGSVNGIRAVPRSGIVIDASRTLSTDPRWRYVNVRLLFNYVKSSLRDGLRWARQEPNRESLWTSVKYTTVMPFLLGLWRQGAFGTGTPAQTYTVIVDATNNPPDQVEQGRLTVEVYFYPSRPAETIVIKVGQQASGATTTEA
jgi:phage tail sheath protein FI